MSTDVTTDPLSRAQGCLLGQFAGDALGSLVEFKTPTAIRRAYPAGLRVMADGGNWNTLAGQPTDDSEMALMLARMLITRGTYTATAARAAYQEWFDSEPFACGTAVANSLSGFPNARSQANGALMRISPLGIFGARHSLERVANWARRDAAITHRHPVCKEANALFTKAIAYAIGTGADAQAVYAAILAWARDGDVPPSLLEATEAAAESPPANYVRQQGWVLIAWRNALWQLLHAPTLEAGVVDTVMRGGDTDTNAAICGALLGAVYGVDAIPRQWSRCVLNCRPQAGAPGVYRPRPPVFWPVEALEVAAALLG